MTTPLTTESPGSPEQKAGSLLTSSFAKGVMGSGMVHAFGGGLTLLGSIILARLLGPEEFGLYGYCIGWITLLAIVARCGAGEFFVRQVSHYQVMGQWSLMKGLFRWGGCFCLGISVVVMLLAASVAWFITESGGAGQVAFFVSLLLIPPMVLTFGWQGVLRGLHHVLWGRIGETIIAPLLSLVLAIVIWWWIHPGMTAIMAIGATLVAWVIATLVVRDVLKRHCPERLHAVEPQYSPRRWVSQMLPLMLVLLLAAINARADMLMLGAIHGTTMAGYYYAASMTAMMVVFPLMAFNNALAPNLSRLYALNQRNELQRVIVHSARIVFCCAIIPAIVLMVGGKWVLTLYGDGFPSATVPLAILAGAQLINAAAGSVGTLLVMTGHGRELLIAMFAAAIINVTLNAILIPSHQMIGAAISTSAGTVVWNLVMVIMVFRRLKLSCTAFGREATGGEPEREKLS